ncbi:spermatogenesis-associated protein 2-like protein [Notolabrus celidotus]|uniref:spermatogenesis-associated protein 2-like protein n=1 Tax=Notolabrus celidotus TaxID=1203425 RepID=UPI00148F8A34|nr:spermatogenesis-associated protein 2-like protein [Notolabrus celidotus]
MKDMSASRQRAKDLVTAYDHSLERQIVAHGSSLACRDEELWKQVEGPLRDGDARDTHCLGLDPLRVMEESLAAAAATAAGTGRVRARGGLRGLERAFEVLEQAALNLYLCPWREEFKVVKMYSGMFTHYIKPVLSMPQIEKLFGLLGYQLGSSRHEKLHLNSHGVSPASLEDLLCLSCAFLLARCECHLLLTALGGHAGDVQWELSVVRERLTGHSLQVALDNTNKMLKVEQQLMEHADGEVDVDLYTDVQENGHQRRAVVTDDESPRSLSWMTPNDASPPSVKAQSNGLTSLPSSSTSLSTREHTCVSTLNCQLSKTAVPESHTARSSSSSARQRRRLAADSQSHSLQAEVCRSEAAADHTCSCLQSTHVCIQLCKDCNSLHDMSCALLDHCKGDDHHVISPDNPSEEVRRSRAVGQHDGSFRVRTSPNLSSSSSAAMSSLALRDEPNTVTAPISYHDCCDLSQPDPQVLCHSCSVFHAGSCKGISYCQSEQHLLKELGMCPCGREASREPLVLCRYCGNQYCRDCWYRSPFECTCGEKFDQSTSV